MKTEFSFNLKAFSEALGIDMDTVYERVVMDIQNRVIQRTPVDTGRARAGWITTEGAPSDYMPPEGEYGAPPPAAGNYKMGQNVYITNNLPYIEALEDGHSRQAPAGMVTITLVEIEAELSLTLQKMS